MARERGGRFQCAIAGYRSLALAEPCSANLRRLIHRRPDVQWYRIEWAGSRHVMRPEVGKIETSAFYEGHASIHSAPRKAQV